jgi:hypothetical protein
MTIVSPVAFVAAAIIAGAVGWMRPGAVGRWFSAAVMTVGVVIVPIRPA